MDKKEDVFSQEDILSLFEAMHDSKDTLFWIFVLLMFSDAEFASNIQLATDVAELKGKVSIMEKLMTK